MGVEIGLDERTDIRDTEFKVCELRDFGTVVALVLMRNGKPEGFCLGRSEMQKLFNALWRYAFRPKGMKYCEGNHAPK